MTRFGYCCVALLLLGICAVSFAEIPQMINYQGKVTDSGGAPVADGTYTMQFRIYDSESGNIPVWDSGDRSVVLNGGIFSINLGDTSLNPISLSFDMDYWLLVTVEGDDQTPRKPLTSIGYAYMSSGLVPGTEVSGEVTTGTASAIKGVNLATIGATYGIRGESNSTAGVGVYGAAPATSGFTYGGRFQSASTLGRGIYGFATAATGEAYGVHGASSSTDGRGIYGAASAGSGTTYGVYGESASTSGTGVYGYAPAGSGSTYGVYGESSSTDGRGVYGHANATSGWTYGVYGLSASSTSGRGVCGYATATTGAGRGVYGRTDAMSGSGVYGYASATTGDPRGVYGICNSTGGSGVYGKATAGSGETYGVQGETASTDGRGVYGYASSTSLSLTYGVYGESASINGRGVYGITTATTGVAYGVVGNSSSTEGRGIYGLTTASIGPTYGVFGKSASEEGRAVYGNATHTTGENYGIYGETSSTDGIGVYGDATATEGTTYGGYFRSESSAIYSCAIYAIHAATTGFGRGVYGKTDSPLGYAGRFSGDVAILGTLHKTAGSFLIDHPLDPENLLLRHNFVESPENLLIYRGKVRLDERGESVVELPEYFAALTKEDAASIHLTPAGKPFLTGGDWNLDFLGFTIYGEPDRAVFWEVLAERDDPSIRRSARPVEEKKGPENKFCDRGKLLDPISFGYPETMGQDYERHVKRRQRTEDAHARMED